MKRKVESIRKTVWNMYWKFHDKRERLVARLKGYLDDLSPEARRRIVPGIFAALTVLILCTLDRAIYDIGRNDGSRMETGHTERVELPIPAETDNHSTSYLYGADEE